MAFLTSGLQSKVELLYQSREGFLVRVRALTAVNLPTLGVLPVQVQPVKVVVHQELHHGGDEVLPVPRVVDHLAVLVALRVIPATQSQQNLLLLRLERRDFLVKLCSEKEFYYKMIQLIFLYKLTTSLTRFQMVFE